MRRQQGALIPLEIAICDAAVALSRHGTPEFHGYAVARELGDRSNTRLLTAHGTLYRALARLERMGLLTSRWEDPTLSEADGRPRRRLYCLTPAGEAALVDARRAADAARPFKKPGEGMAPA
jgi:PadR family transcriptional regulator, regulatory protein PadR